MKTMTLRNVPDDVVDHIMETARQANQSINAASITALRRAFGIEPTTRRKRNLSAIAGTWTKRDAEAFSKATRHLDKIEPEVWGS